MPQTEEMKRLLMDDKRVGYQLHKLGGILHSPDMRDFLTIIQNTVLMNLEIKLKYQIPNATNVSEML